MQAHMHTKGTTHGGDKPHRRGQAVDTWLQQVWTADTFVPESSQIRCPMTGLQLPVQEAAVVFRHFVPVPRSKEEHKLWLATPVCIVPYVAGIRTLFSQAGTDSKPTDTWLHAIGFVRPSKSRARNATSPGMPRIQREKAFAEAARAAERQAAVTQLQEWDVLVPLGLPQMHLPGCQAVLAQAARNWTAGGDNSAPMTLDTIPHLYFGAVCSLVAAVACNPGWMGALSALMAAAAKCADSPHDTRLLSMARHLTLRPGNPHWQVRTIALALHPDAPRCMPFLLTELLDNVVRAADKQRARGARAHPCRPPASGRSLWDFSSAPNTLSDTGTLFLVFPCLVRAAQWGRRVKGTGTGTFSDLGEANYADFLGRLTHVSQMCRQPSGRSRGMAFLRLGPVHRKKVVLTHALAEAGGLSLSVAHVLHLLFYTSQCHDLNRDAGVRPWTQCLKDFAVPANSDSLAIRSPLYLISGARIINLSCTTFVCCPPNADCGCVVLERPGLYRIVGQSVFTNDNSDPVVHFLLREGTKNIPSINAAAASKVTVTLSADKVCMSHVCKYTGKTLTACFSRAARGEVQVVFRASLLFITFHPLQHHPSPADLAAQHDAEFARWDPEAKSLLSVAEVAHTPRTEQPSAPPCPPAKSLTHPSTRP